jgi:hypothetical protein
MKAPVADAPEDAATEAHAADRRQAEYFRRLLHERYTQLGDKIAGHQRLLTRYQNRDESSEARRMRRIIRDEERERETVKRLIEELDSRFSLDGPISRTTRPATAAQTIDPGAARY